MNNTLTFNNGNSIPTLGLGTWRSEVHKVGDAVEYALTSAGYKHIDCASIYGNEKEIGEVFNKVFSAGEIKREEIFITSKLWNTNHHPEHVEQACRKTLEDLQLEYLDLYLIHWGIAFEYGENPEPVRNGDAKTEPVALYQTWKAMEQLVEKGLVKSIGVANYTAPMILDLLSYAKIKPVTNQIEVHPYNAQTELVEYCNKHQIHVTAYSPLGSAGGDAARPLEDAVITKLATKYGKSPAQVLIKWSLQRGLIVIPKSSNPTRITENSQVTDFELSEADMTTISALNKNHRFVNPSEWWGIPYFN
jgi:diketogulonate reductase-like aldo/keto reductase